MVAAVQPAHPAETLSTLRYAHEYSTLQSDLSTKIPKLKSQVRQLQQRRETLAREFDAFCFHINMQSRGMKWDKSTVNERHVRVKRTAKQLFEGHPYLRWSDGHEGKLNINAVGIAQDVCSVPPVVTCDDMPDGRRHVFRDGGSEELGHVTRVVYAGRHGHPPVILWYPEAALEDITPPKEVRRLLTEAEEALAQLQMKQAQLRELEKQFAAQRQHWQGPG